MSLVDVEAPILGFCDDNWIVTQWWLPSRSSVKALEVVAVLETDDVIAQIEVYDQGILEIIVEQGASVKPGQVIARLHTK